MRYLMFCVTKCGNEYTQTVHAQDDNTAVRRMEIHMQKAYRIPASDIMAIAGVWEKSPKFYSSSCIEDLEPCED